MAGTAPVHPGPPYVNDTTLVDPLWQSCFRFPRRHGRSPGEATGGGRRPPSCPQAIWQSPSARAEACARCGTTPSNEISLTIVRFLLRYSRSPRFLPKKNRSVEAHRSSCFAPEASTHQVMSLERVKGGTGGSCTGGVSGLGEKGRGRRFPPGSSTGSAPAFPWLERIHQL